MKTVIVGYGRMGQLIEEVLVKRGHTVLCRVDSAGTGDVRDLNASTLKGADGVIEFALAEGIAQRIKIYAESALPVLIGTTGWAVEEGRAMYANSRGALLRGTNFSLGAHLFFRLTAAAAKLINRVEEYDVGLTEFHHTGKADYPSGTAITAAEGILAELDRKKVIVKDLPQSGPLAPDALHVAAVRVGAVPGIHEMRMDSMADFLTIRHEARNRGGFALGAVRGLEWLQGKTGWHDAEEFFSELLDSTP
ncbi:MAG: hypothetical protein B0D92_00135 [Spirochaeta sp. LUC14_002_19_P3]|nr:MAG: hypothetical protein B0D92_00135 [Spirochaeta sp. LUC14_002_19_P3]